MTNEFLVDTQDAAIVRRILADISPSLQVTGQEDVPALGLSKLSATSGRAGVDTLLRAIRDRAKADYAGWYPALDVDHDVTDVETNIHVKIAATDPVPVEPDGERLVGPAAASGATGAPDGPRVGIADAQVYDHPELAGRYLGTPLTGDGTFNGLAGGHATFVAGTVLRRAPSARLVCRTVLVPGGPNSSWDVAGRLIEFLADDLDILNMSFGCLTDGEPPLALRRAVDRLGVRTVLVAAAGNHDLDAGAPAPIFPGAFPGVLAVGSAAADGTLAPTTPRAPWMDATAPGVNLVGPFLRGMVAVPDSRAPKQFASGYVRWSGSSFATANVTGEIARVMAHRGLDAFAARDTVLRNDGATADIAPYDFFATAAVTQ